MHTLALRDVQKSSSSFDEEAFRSLFHLYRDVQEMYRDVQETEHEGVVLV